MRSAPIVHVSNARDAADSLVAALREYDLEGAALVRATAVARLLRAWLVRGRPGNPLALGRGVDHVRAVCASRRLHESAPVRRALTAFTVAAERPFDR